MNELPPMGTRLELGEYVHSKSGNHYWLLFEGRDSETTEPVVAYQAMVGHRETWFRPKAMWSELVEVNRKMVPRFQKVDPPKSRTSTWFKNFSARVFGP